MCVEMIYVTAIALTMGRGEWTYMAARALYFPEVTEY